ncbi:MAG: TetR/AcrR family transcriptional regulator C-terminal domain-containing protein [Mycobacterium sp.]
MQLHKHDVVAAAIAILDGYGIADLTMRRLARELDITPGALYWHFASKQQLLGAVADQLLRPVCAHPGLAAATDWRRRVAMVCTRMRDALLSHTDGAELVSASFAAGQSHGVIEVLGLLADAAGDAGLDAEHAALAARTLVYYVLGATADEQSRLQWDAAGALSDGPAGSPLRPPADPTAGFEFGLRLLIDGLATQSAQSVADRMLDTFATVPSA